MLNLSDRLLEGPAIEVGGGSVDRIVAAVQQRIRRDGLQPGNPLPSESALATEHGVSRAVVREAFSSLAALKLIALGNGRRAVVAAPDSAVLALLLDHSVHTRQTSIQQVLDVRRTLELRTVVLAALRRTDAEAREITAHTAGMAACLADSAAVMEHDIALHIAIADASRNPLFALLMGAFQVVTRQTWPVGWRTRTTAAARQRSVDCHAAIATAIEDRDPRRAETAMAEHFDETVRVLLAAGIV